MFKLLVLSCLLVSCLADPMGSPSWMREGGRRPRKPRGCADRVEGWRACARLNDTDTLAPHGYDCSLFFYCSNAGARPACRKCPAGLHFNPQLQVCDWPDNVDCISRPRPPRPRPTGHPSHNETAYPNGNATVPVSDYNSTTTEVSLQTDASLPPENATDEPSTETSASALIESTVNYYETSPTPAAFSWRNYIPWSR